MLRCSSHPQYLLAGKPRPTACVFINEIPNPSVVNNEESFF